MYRVGEFAAIAGVTVRTLHHYDRLKLLCPRRTQAGYRVYSDADLERLEQIVALKFIGMPLARVKVVLDRDSPRLRDALRQQEHVLEEKRKLLDRAIDAVREARASVGHDGSAPTSALKKIIEVMEMQENADWAMQYYSPEAVEKIEARRPVWSPELQARIETEWLQLFADVEAAIDKDPASPEAQALADRWMELVGQFTAGDPQITEGVKKLYADRENWPADFKQKMQPFGNPRVWEYMDRVRRARGAATR
jgi:MerR family transcriptional regulator, thiopeptide resistance regulator